MPSYTDSHKHGQSFTWLLTPSWSTNNLVICCLAAQCYVIERLVIGPAAQCYVIERLVIGLAAQCYVIERLVIGPAAQCYVIETRVIGPAAQCYVIETRVIGMNGISKSLNVKYIYLACLVEVEYQDIETVINTDIIICGGISGPRENYYTLSSIWWNWSLKPKSRRSTHYHPSGGTGVSSPRVSDRHIIIHLVELES